jgi:hypothetical protein
MRVLALGLVVALAACGGGPDRRPAPAKAKDARCTFKRVWYPPALPGHEMVTVGLRRRAQLLRQAHLPDRGTDLVVDVKHGKFRAALFRVKRDVTAVKRRYDAVEPQKGYTDFEPLPHFRIINYGGDSALEYGRKGCALFVGFGAGADVNQLFTVIYADN